MDAGWLAGWLVAHKNTRPDVPMSRVFYRPSTQHKSKSTKIKQKKNENCKPHKNNIWLRVCVVSFLFDGFSHSHRAQTNGTAVYAPCTVVMCVHSCIAATAHCRQRAQLLRERASLHRGLYPAYPHTVETTHIQRLLRRRRRQQTTDNDDDDDPRWFVCIEYSLLKSQNTFQIIFG